MKQAKEVNTGKVVTINNARLFDDSIDNDAENLAFNVSYIWWYTLNGQLNCANCDGPWELMDTYGNRATVRPVIEFNDSSIKVGSVLTVDNCGKTDYFVVFEENKAINMAGTDTMGYGEIDASELSSSTLLDCEEGCTYELDEVDDASDDRYVSIDKIIDMWFNS